MSLKYTKYYLLNIEEQDKPVLLTETPRDLIGSYRVDYNKTENCYIYNEDIGVSEWGLELIMDESVYKTIPDIFTACHGTIHDYRYDRTDGSRYMEYIRQVKSVSGAEKYYFVVHCSRTDYIPSRTISSYLADWDDGNPGNAAEVDYETLAVQFCYTNPDADIYKLYQLPLITRADWGKYLHVKKTDGSIEWGDISGNSTEDLMSALSPITGVPSNRYPVIPYNISANSTQGPHCLLMLSLRDYDDIMASINVTMTSAGVINPAQCSLSNAKWVLDGNNDISYIVLQFAVPVLPDIDSNILVDIGNCEYKYSMSQTNDITSDCILDSISRIGEYQSHYIYDPAAGNNLYYIEDAITCLGVTGYIFRIDSAESSIVSAIPLEIRFSLAESVEEEDSDSESDELNIGDANA